MNKLYLFDCFGVVVSDVSTIWMNKRLNREQQLFFRNEVFRKVDCGLMSFDEAMNALAEVSKIPKQKVVEEWEADTYPLTDNLSVIAELKKQGTVALLSNASVEYVDRLFGQFDLFKYFDRLFVSAKYGCAKPDKELYEICLASFGQKFDEIYFVDDNPQNLVEPRKMGVKTVLFANTEQMKRDLGL